MLQLFNIRKSYTTASFTQQALDDVSIAFRDNEFVAILGPSGSGKTTLLNIIGGLDHYDEGNLVIDGISTEQYKDRDWDTYRNNRIGFVFQSYNLIPHQTVLSNVELALTLSGVSPSERHERAKQALDEVGLSDHINKKPSQLSGGQMQRVAIARALINNPEILLADEPTGALDSKTSVQIMALLTEIAKDRLVIMVTHNPELAKTYANRTVNLRDGKIIEDTNPFEPAKDDEHISEKSIRKTTMSFLTALSLSFNNLMTKKGRTIMTAFAGSIGIIGIAAILALANGVNNYIKSVEEDTLSMYPLSIQSSGIDMTSLLAIGGTAGGTGDGSETASASNTEEKPIGESKMISNMVSRIGSNDLASLKEFLDNGDSGIEQYTNTIQYSYNVTPQIYNPDTANGIRQVNPDASFSSLGFGSSTSSNSLMSASMSTDVFDEMMNDTSYLESQYEIVAGNWPEGYDECLLVLSSSGNISDFVLYAMGLRDYQELDEMVKQLANNEEVTAPEGRLRFDYDEIMGVTFKLVNSADYFQYDEDFDVWKDLSEDVDYMRDVIERSTDLHISGIVKPNPEAAATSLSGGLYYTSDLTDYLIEQAAQTDIVKSQLAKPDINVFTGKTFDEEAEGSNDPSFDMGSLISIDENAISNAFNFDTSALNVDFSNLMDLSAVASSMPETPEIDMSAIIAMMDLESTVDTDALTKQMNTMMAGVLQGYLRQALTSGVTDPEKLVDGLPAYLNSAPVQAQMGAALNGVIAVNSDGIEQQAQIALQSYMSQIMQNTMAAMMASIQTQISVGMQSAMAQMTANMAGAMSVDEAAFADAFQFNMDEKELEQLMMTFMMGSQQNSYDNNLKKLGYSSPSKPSGIDIYPIDFESKEEIIKILDGYNDRMEAEGEDDKVITYTDLVGTLMSSVTDIINMVSYVLVAFVAISLVVSSIMIGVITYISVLERKKEIGILRAIGASKRDIRWVFNAETLIVGFVAGALGIIVTLLITLPVNAFVYAEFDVPNVALLPVEAAVVLIVISMGLTFLSGLIPSSAASRKDPVEALRSE